MMADDEISSTVIGRTPKKISLLLLGKFWAINRFQVFTGRSSWANFHVGQLIECSLDLFGPKVLGHDLAYWTNIQK